MNENRKQQIPHNPGPWTIDETDVYNGDEIAIKDNAGCVICQVWPMGEDFDGEEDDELNVDGLSTSEYIQTVLANGYNNARLIAAAPEMFELIKELMRESAENNPHLFKATARQKTADMVRRIQGEE